MKPHIGKLFAISYFLIIFLDILWINIMSNTYTCLGPIMRMTDSPLKSRAWALIVIGALLILPFTRKKECMIGFAWGALYGLLLFGVYDLINFPTFARSPWTITLIDIIWGIIACGMLLIILKRVDNYLH